METLVRQTDNAVCQSNESTGSAEAAKGVHGCTLCYLLHRLIDFREAEVQSVAEMHGISKEQLNLRSLSENDHPYSPFRLIDLPSAAIISKVAQRTMLTKGMFEIWGEGSNLAELKESVRQCPSSMTDKWMGPKVSFKFVVDGFGRKLTMPEQLHFMDELADVCPFQGEVDLVEPQLKLWVIVCDCSSNGGLPKGIATRIIVARELETRGTKEDARTFALKHRRYLGPTSMDTELSFIMCNMAHITSRDLVFDPFAGTGSILVSAAAVGAHVVGGDIDLRAIRDGKLDKKGSRVNVYSNFRDYKLADPVGLLRIDAHNPPWRGMRPGFLDAVVCDPPYGVRAGGRKMIPADPDAESAPKQMDYIPSTAPYSLGECLRDLVDSAAQMLVLNGRLCYWLPDFNEDGKVDETSISSFRSEEGDLRGSVHRDVNETSAQMFLPLHPCMLTISNSVQVLSTRYVRRMITMVKRCEYDAAAVTAWKATLGDPAMAIDNMHDVVYEKRDTATEKPAKKKFRGKSQ